MVRQFLMDYGIPVLALPLAVQALTHRRGLAPT